MDQKNRGSGSGLPSNVPAKRKRGRPRKYETIVHGGENVSRNETTDHPMAPHLKGLPVPRGLLLHRRTVAHGSVPSSVPASEEHLVLPTEINSGISVSVDKDLPKNETSIMTSKLESDKTAKQGSSERKRGRPQKYEKVVRNLVTDAVHDGENMSGNETIDYSMVGNLVTGVIEGAFGAGYLVNVKVLGEPDRMRGLVFKPDQVIPVTPENDVAPHLKMIKRTDLPIPPPLNTQTAVHGFVPPIPPLLNRQIPIPVLPNTQTEVHGSGPSSVPVSEEHLVPTEINSGISVSVEKDLPKNETSTIMSKLESDKTAKQGDTLLELDVDASTQVKESTADGGVIRDSRTASPTVEDTDMELRTKHQDDTLHELDVDASTQVKESTVDGGVIRDSRAASPAVEDTDMELRTEHQGDTLHELDVDASIKVKESTADGDGGATREYSRPASDIISLVQTTENTDKEELITEQQAMPSVQQLDQLVQEEPVSSNIVIPASGGPESKQSEDSEEISKSVDNIEEKQDSPKTDLPDTKTETDLPIVSDK